MASAKRKAAGRKAARTRARNKAARRKSAHKRKKLSQAGVKFKYMRVRGRRPKHKRGKRKHARKRKHGRKYSRHPRRKRGSAHRRRRNRGIVRRSNRSGKFVAKGNRIRGRKQRGRSHRAGRLVAENPLGGMEIVIGLITGVVGYTTADVIDRFVVSRERKDDKGVVMGRRWNTAPLSDDLLVRGGVGVAVAAVPLIGAHFVKTPWIRSALQLFGFGAAFHLAGKAVDDLAAYALKDTAANSTFSGRRLYGTELQSRVAVGLPAGTAGLPPGLGAYTCPTCRRADGLGACCPPQNPKKEFIQDMAARQTGGASVAELLQKAKDERDAECPPGSTNGGGGGASISGQVPAALSPSVPTVSQTISNPFGVNGLGEATAAVRAYPNAYRALRSNAQALMAVRNNNATRQQRDIVERVAAQHGRAISVFTTVNSRFPGAIETAGGLAGLNNDEQSQLAFNGISKRNRETMSD